MPGHGTTSLNVVDLAPSWKRVDWKPTPLPSPPPWAGCSRLVLKSNHRNCAFWKNRGSWFVTQKRMIPLSGSSLVHFGDFAVRPPSHGGDI